MLSRNEYLMEKRVREVLEKNRDLFSTLCCDFPEKNMYRLPATDVYVGFRSKKATEFDRFVPEQTLDDLRAVVGIFEIDRRSPTRVTMSIVVSTDLIKWCLDKTQGSHFEDWYCSKRIREYSPKYSIVETNHLALGSDGLLHPPVDEPFEYEQGKLIDKIDFQRQYLLGLLEWEIVRPYILVPTVLEYLDPEDAKKLGSDTQTWVSGGDIFLKSKGFGTRRLIKGSRIAWVD